MFENYKQIKNNYKGIKFLCLIIITSIIKYFCKQFNSQSNHLMPPKKQQKKEIVAVFQKSVFWEYKIYPQENLEKADQFLNTFTNQLKALIDQNKHLNQNYKILADKMGIDIHPCLAVVPKQQTQFPQLKNKDYGQKYALFLNHKIDAITLKLFAFLIGTYKINTIKFSNNNLENEANQIKKLFDKQDSISTLYFEWNQLQQIPNRNQIFLSLVRPNIQHLILRQCKLGNQAVSSIISKIKQLPQNNIQSLDLYGNLLTSEISQKICKFIQESKKVQFIGLSKNQLNTHQFLKKLFNSIGEIPLSQEEYQAHKQKQKQRDQVVQRNKKKKKGAPDEPVPFVFQVKQTQQGRFYVKNTSLKILNLSTNGIKDSVNKESNYQLIKNFVQNQGKGVQIFLQGNSFTKKTKDMLKLYQNILL